MKDPRQSIVLSLLLFMLMAVGTACSDKTGNNGNNNGNFTLGEDMTLTVNPETLSFGAVALDTTEVREITLRHEGTSGIIELRAITLKSEGTDFTLVQPDRDALNPGESTTFSLSYKPSDDVHDEGEVQVDTNIPDTGSGTVTLTIPVTTLPQEVTLLSEPAQVDFGPVQSKTALSRTIAIRNIGQLPVTLSKITIAEGEDFEVTEQPAANTIYNPGESFDVTLSYAPTGYDQDTGAMRISFSALSGDGTTDVILTGHEVWGRLKLDPQTLDFGMQVPGVLHEKTVNLTNEGTYPLTISKTSVLEISEWSHTVGVVSLTEDLVLDVGASEEVTIGFVPDANMPPSHEPLAHIIFHSDDPEVDGETSLPVFGKRRGPGLEVYPPDVVHFGYVGKGGTSVRTLTLYNANYVPISVEQVWVEGGFTVKDPDNYGPTQAAPKPEILEAGETREIELTFTNEGGDWTTDWGKVVVESDDLFKPVWEVLLHAQAGTQGHCIAQLVPEQIDFGFLVAGESRVSTIHIVNIGNSTCGFHSAAIVGCAGAAECESSDEPISTDFTIVSQPEVAFDNLPPGGSLSIEVSFDAPDMTDDPLDAIRYFYGRLRIALQNDANEELDTVPAAGWEQDPNLVAHAARGQLVVSPPMIDFGEVPIGCKSEFIEITATNAGTAPIGITDWEFVDCSAHFAVEDYPVLDDPMPDGTYVSQLTGGAKENFLVSFTPDDESPTACTLRIHHTSGPAVDVLLKGQGTYTTDVTDKFTDSATQKVDVLFVVDDSGSMSAEQGNLAASFEAFIKKAAEWQSDFQIGVVTTTVEFPVAGVLRGYPPYVSNMNWEKLINNVQVGTGGSGHEQGLWAAKIALSSPLTDYTEEPCEKDSDCGFLHKCMAGVCGGANQGFLREDAALELIFLSDEHDQSPETADEYLKYFKAIKGFDKPELLHIHAIAGPAGGCESDTGNAVAGHPYLELAQATGGITYSICEADFAKGLESIGEVAFSAQMRYFLTKLPAPTTIEVTIDGFPCSPITSGVFNWKYDPASNSVQLTEEGVCKAEPGSKVEIYYQLLCFAE